jgi:hypothetical protein
MMIAVASPRTVNADLVFVANRADLGGNDFVDWGVLGPTFTSVANPFLVISAGGVSTGVSRSNGLPFVRRDQATPAAHDDWNGHFTPGDHVLSTSIPSQIHNSPLILDFGSRGIRGGGLQIDFFFNLPYIATIEAFDEAGNSLGQFSRSVGVDFAIGDNSAPFLGVQSSSANIHRLTFLASSPGFGPDAFGINRFDFVTAGAVPEPSALTLLGLGTLGLIGYGWRRWRS